MAPKKRGKELKKKKNLWDVNPSGHANVCEHKPSTCIMLSAPSRVGPGRICQGAENTGQRDIRKVISMTAAFILLVWGPFLFWVQNLWILKIRKRKKPAKREEGKRDMKQISLKYRPRYKIPCGWSKLTGEIKSKGTLKPGGFSSFFPWHPLSEEMTARSLEMQNNVWLCQDFSLFNAGKQWKKHQVW